MGKNWLKLILEISPVLGAVKLIDSVFRLGLPYVDSIGIFIPGRTLNPFFEFAGCLLIGILLYLAGRGCWKLLLLYCQNVSKTKEHFAI